MFKRESWQSLLAWGRRHAGLAAVLVAAALLAGFFGPRAWLGPVVEVDTVVAREFVQTVVASGRVETPHRVELGVQITGSVLRVAAAEGQMVAAGAPLIELDAAELRAALNLAERAVQQAQARQRQLREVQLPVAEQALNQAIANREAARQVLERDRGLLAKGFVGQAVVDEAQRADQVAAAQLESARRQLASAAPAGSDADLADAALAQARAGVQAARARLAYATVRAPVAGTVIDRKVEPGDVVQPGRTLLVLSPNPDSGETQLVVQVDEKNLRLLQLGQPALASADAYPQERFKAELVFINPSVDAQRGAVEVRLRVAAPPATLRQDMTVSVDVEVARRANALVVPVASLHDADGAAPWLFKVGGGKAQRQAVRIGLRSGGQAEVLDGLQAGDQVIATPAGGAALAVGARIRPRVRGP